MVTTKPVGAEELPPDVLGRVELPPELTSPMAARRFVAALLDGSDHLDVDAVLLAVSELASNAVTHARTELAVTVRDSSARLRVEVSDHTAGVPVRRRAGPDDERGRGLDVVARSSSAWGWDATPSGKTVWVEFHHAAPG